MALTKPFCENGNKTPIPATTPDGSVSYDQGFGAFYALPPEEGGKFIDRAQFNQLMYDTTSAVIDNSDNITTIQGNLATAQSNITTLQGDVTTAKANITTLQGKFNTLESDVSGIESTISQVISSDVTPVGVYKNVENKTVGANGDFKTIQEAFAYAQTHQQQAIAQNLTLTLLEDLNNPDLYLRGMWYPYLTIDCNGFVLADILNIDFSCFAINNLKLNGRLAATNSNLYLAGNIDINYRNEDWARGCITGAAGSIITVGGTGNWNFSATPNSAAFRSTGNSMIYVIGASDKTITQTTGQCCFFVVAGGIVQLSSEINMNLTGVTVPKASQAANIITDAGLIIGNYYSMQ
jgi:uncharacterized protein YoxC